MVDLVITAASVVAGTNATITRGIAGATITAGQVVYLSPTTGKWDLADTDSATAAVRAAHGIALNGGAVNQQLSVQTAGDITIGATIEAGTGYWLSGTPGGICPVADVLVGDYPCLLGLGKSTSVLALNIQYPGVIKV